MSYFIAYSRAVECHWRSVGARSARLVHCGVDKLSIDRIVVGEIHDVSCYRSTTAENSSAFMSWNDPWLSVSVVLSACLSLCFYLSLDLDLEFRRRGLLDRTRRAADVIRAQPCVSLCVNFCR